MGWSAPPGVWTPVLAIAGAVVLLVYTKRRYGLLSPGETASDRSPRTKTAVPRVAKQLFFLAGCAILVAAILTALHGAITASGAVLMLAGTGLLVWALLKSGRSDAARWALEVLIIIECLSMLEPYLRR